MYGLSLVVESGGYCLVLVCGFLIAVATLVAEHRLWARGLSSCRSRAPEVVAHGLSCSVACGIFPDQALNLCPLYWQEDF